MPTIVQADLTLKQISKALRWAQIQTCEDLYYSLLIKGLEYSKTYKVRQVRRLCTRLLEKADK